jgi:MoxR-like ATPase
MQEGLPAKPSNLEVSMKLRTPQVDTNFVPAKKMLNALRAISAVDGLRNVLLTGPTGCGKTAQAEYLSAILKRPYFESIVSQFIEPLDLLGTKGVRDGKTYFSESAFVEAVETDEAIVVLDEINRAPASILNMLIPLLDHRGSVYIEELGRYVRVGKNVLFIGTANIGAEFSGTYRLDEAIVSRFPYRFEVSFLEEDQEATMIQARTQCDEDSARLLAKVGSTLRAKSSGFGGALSRQISTRQLLATAELVAKGLSIHDALDITVVPVFDKEGGTNSEQSQVLQSIQLVCG